MGALVAAGPTNSVVVDKQRMYYMTGKVCLNSLFHSCRSLPRLQWKNSGDGMLWSLRRIRRFHIVTLIGSSGAPYTTFRYMQDIQFVFRPLISLQMFICCFRRACKVRLVSCGGVTHWLTTDDEDDSTMTVAWGQNAHNGRTSVFPILLVADVSL